MMVFSIITMVAFTLIALFSLYRLKKGARDINDRVTLWVVFLGSTTVVVGNVLKYI